MLISLENKKYSLPLLVQPWWYEGRRHGNSLGKNEPGDFPTISVSQPYHCYAIPLQTMQVCPLRHLLWDWQGEHTITNSCKLSFKWRYHAVLSKPCAHYILPKPDPSVYSLRTPALPYVTREMLAMLETLCSLHSPPSPAFSLCTALTVNISFHTLMNPHLK